MVTKIPKIDLGTHPILGVFLALGSAVALGVTPSFAKVALQEGSDTLTIILIRTGLVPVISLFFYALITKQPLNVTKIPLKATLLAGISISMVAFGMLYAINYISPNLAVVILYSFPIIVLVSVATVNRKMPSFRLTSLYFIAFIGLAVAIGAKFDSINWFGVALAFFAAIGASIIMFLGHIAGPQVKSHSLLFVGSVAVIIIAIIMMLITGNANLPTSTLGWIAASITALGYTIGMMMVLVSTAVLRPDLASLFMNLEPFIGIATVYFVLGDVLSITQLTAVCVVMIAISLGGLVAHREHMAPE